MKFFLDNKIAKSPKNYSKEMRNISSRPKGQATGDSNSMKRDILFNRKTNKEIMNVLLFSDFVLGIGN